MILVFGGAFQGKPTWAAERFGLSQADMKACAGEIAP